MTFQVPNLSLVVLVGASGSGKSTFARKHFGATEVVSLDYCRGVVSDDMEDQSAINDALELLHHIAGKRLARGLLTVVDATNVQKEARRSLIALAREHHAIPVAIVLNLPAKLCTDRNESRPDRHFGARVSVEQHSQLRRSLRTLDREGFRHVYAMSTPEQVEAAVISRVPLWSDKREETGPFDIIGDVHGCFSELCSLLEKLGYTVSRDSLAPMAIPPAPRRAVFLGDLVDRGPATPAVLRLVMNMVRAGHALCVPGNHDVKLMRKLRGNNVQLKHGLAQSMEQLAAESQEFKAEAADFIDGLVSHYVLDGGDLVVAHAGMREAYQGRGSGVVRDFALYGETTGELDQYGLPIRYNWAADYRGRAMVVYGHTPAPSAEWVNRTICIDTGCVFGGALTALRYPEKELVEVEAERAYFEPEEQAAPEPGPAREYYDLLDIADVGGKRIVRTRIHHTVTIREQNSAVALELMSRFAVDPRWLVYLPPTMSSSETAPEGGLLEHPREAFGYFRRQGVQSVVCEEKHMGSRAVAVICRNSEVARRRFGAADGRRGVIYTRTGRPFFSDPDLEQELVARIGAAVAKAGLWEALATDWMCLDAELLPWSAKAQELLRDQYAAVGAAAAKSLDAVGAALAKARARLEAKHTAESEHVERAEQVGELVSTQDRISQRQQAVRKFVEAYHRYCWPVASLDDIKLAPFHLLASEGRVHVDNNHIWHMATLAKLAEVDPILMATPYRVVDLTDQENQEAGIAWWESLTGSGGEGVVIKPLEWITHGKRGLVQPGIKCRGPEYLRIIYGPEYLLPENLERLRGRSVNTKRALALREFALGIEALYRFVEKEPLHRVHECVFGVLALESEPVDPRL